MATLGKSGAALAAASPRPVTPCRHFARQNDGSLASAVRRVLTGPQGLLDGDPSRRQRPSTVSALIRMLCSEADAPNEAYSQCWQQGDAVLVGKPEPDVSG